ncbi:TAP-like protein [Umezawaea tangerina]|uniref:TAP-like protein n=1 Tax=Umezawaea tangerina TaxID=84725 RepID=A0A2T0T701_9PSEU|nr:alpha/beta hydrolase [Umezawaea tangerina]PRY41456.1 TAP-like protein [Umezawaea tangerina]
MSNVHLRRKSRLALAAVVVAASTVACTATPSSSAPTRAEVRWGLCPQDAGGPGLECALLDVPLDYHAPDGRKIQIAISRLASTHPEKRRGILLTNSGGPGGEGLRHPLDLKAVGLPQDVLDSYDVIGMDPRGVGRSTPVTCDLAKTPAYYTNIPLHAATADDVRTKAVLVKQVADNCAHSASQDLLPHISTANTARDLDRVRAALGEEKASYFGISYGTYLGAVYTTLFPASTDRVLIDSSLGPGGWDREGSRMFAQGFEDRFPDFAEYVAANHPDYGLGTTPEQVTAKYYELTARLDALPGIGTDAGGLFRQTTFGGMYYDNALGKLAETWRDVDNGTWRPDAAPSTESKPSGGTTAGPASADQEDAVRWPAKPADNYLASQLHVLCNDSRWPTSVQTYVDEHAEDRVAHPMFGSAASNIGPCAFWPDPVEPQTRITGQGPSNVLIVQNLRDPITPLAVARKMRGALGDRARMITVDQGGHLAYPFKENKCANDKASEFLVTGKRVTEDLACAAEPG